MVACPLTHLKSRDFVDSTISKQGEICLQFQLANQKSEILATSGKKGTLFAILHEVLKI